MENGLKEIQTLFSDERLAAANKRIKELGKQ